MMARLAKQSDQLELRRLLDLPEVWFEKLLRDPAQALVVYEAGGLPVGFAHLSFLPRIGQGELAFISTFVIAEAFRYIGIGTELAAYCEQAAAAKGCKEMAVQSKEAYPFFQRQGYKEARKYLVKEINIEDDNT